MKSKTNKILTELDKLQNEYRAVENKFGKNHSKTIFFRELIDFERSIESAKSKISEREFKDFISDLPEGTNYIFSNKNVDRRYEAFYGTINQVASKIFKKEYKKNEIVAAATLFMYLIDCDYGVDNHFKDEKLDLFFLEATSNATGEFLINSCLDSRVGFFNFYQKLLERGFSLLEDLVYPKAITNSKEPYIEIVGIKESQIIPYHLFQNNLKDFKKKIKLPENRISTSSFIDFTDEIKTVQKDVIEAVAEFWNINKVLKDYKVVNFNNLITLEGLHTLTAQFLSTDFTNKKYPILKIKNKFIPVRKLLEFILIRNNITYNINADLIYQNQYYIKMEFNPETMVKWSCYNMLDEEDGSLLDIKGYVSPNAFNKPSNMNSETSEINKKIEEDEFTDFVPDSATDVIMQARERKSKEFLENNAQLAPEQEQNNYEQIKESNNDFSFNSQPELKNNSFASNMKVDLSAEDDFENTTPVSTRKAELEEKELLKNTEIEKEENRLKDNFYIDSQQYKEIMKERKIEKKEIKEYRKKQSKEELFHFEEDEENNTNTENKNIENEEFQINEEFIDFDMDELFNKADIENNPSENYDANDTFFDNMSDLLGTQTKNKDKNQEIAIEEEKEEINVEPVEKESVDAEPVENKETIETQKAPEKNIEELKIVDEQKIDEIKTDDEEKTDKTNSEIIVDTPDENIIDVNVNNKPTTEIKVDFDEIELKTNNVKFDFLNESAPIYPDYDNKPLCPVEEINIQPTIRIEKEPRKNIIDDEVQNIIENKVQNIVEDRVQNIVENKVQNIVEEKIQNIVKEKADNIKTNTVNYEFQSQETQNNKPQSQEIKVEKKEKNIIDSKKESKTIPPINLPPIPTRKNNPSSKMPSIPPRKKK